MIIQISYRYSFFYFLNNGYFIRKNVKYNINARQLSFIN